VLVLIHQRRLDTVRATRSPNTHCRPARISPVP